MALSMRVEERTFLSRIDFNFIFVILALNLVGLVNLYSATHGLSSESMSSLFYQQIVWLVGGWLIFLVGTFFSYTMLGRIAYIFYGLNLAALIFVTFFGKIAYGAQRWIDLGFFRYQPSETMKLAMIVIFARILAVRNPHGVGMGLRELFWPLVLLLVPFAFVVEQPDLGTAMMIMAVGGSMLLFVKIRKGILFAALIVGAIGAILAWNYGLREYQKHRITTFLSPTTDPRGTGYNSIQSKIAVGSGKFLGKGFRQGTQSQLEFLPERHTDFIFSVLSEERGFIGSFMTLGLFCILFLIGIKIATQAPDKFGALLTVGVMAYLFWHMFVNIGMVIGLLPIVGVPLPLLSYGGTSMLTTMAGLAIVSSVSYRRYLF